MFEQCILAAPSISAECCNHVESIQQCSSLPDFPVTHPPFLDLVCSRSYLQQQRDEEPGCCRSFAIQESC